MRNFIVRALDKLDKLDNQQVYKLLYDLADENERLEVVLQSIPDGILVGDRENKTVFANKAAERLLQLQKQDGAEDYVWELIRDDELRGFIRKSIENDEKVRDKEFTFDRHGTQKILFVSIIPQVKNGTIQGNLILANDVTEKKKRDARLRRAESLAGLTTLAAGVAHEIKNPLGSMSIHIQLIQKALAADTTDESLIQNHLDIIDEEINRLNGIVVDFLFAVRPMDTRVEERDVNEILADVLELVKVELEQSGIRCERELDPDLPEVMIDEKYMKQAFLNCIKNAIAAMPEGGVLRVRSGRRGDMAAVDFSDTGRGISEENIEKIFEPYFTTKDFGSGLGLTVVYKILKEHMGDITVQSKENEGTTFTLLIPIPQKEQHLLSWKGEGDEV